MILSLEKEELNEKHAYEKCQYHDYIARVKEMKRQHGLASGSRTLMDLE